MGGVLAKVVFKSGEDRFGQPPRDLQDVEMRNIDGDVVRVGDYFEGKKVILFVNVATK